MNPLPVLPLSPPSLVRQLDLQQNIIVYKCLGHQDTLVEYQAAYPPRDGDWAAMYLQFDLPHALGTVPYRWEHGYAMATVVRITLSKVKVVIIDAEWMPDATVNGQAKAAAVKKALDLPDEACLMAELASRGLALACRETEKQFELVLGSGLLESAVELVDEEVVMQLRPDKCLCTDAYRETKTAQWKRWDEGMAHVEVPPPDWIVDSLPK